MTRFPRSIVLIGLVAAVSALPGAARATVPAGFTETLVTGGLSAPTAMAFAPDGRIFVTQQTGALRVIKNGTLLPTPFVSLTVDFAGERGLLGVAFDPNFATNNFVYVYYTVPGPPSHNRISRLTASGDVALAGSELPIFELDNLNATNHNGGAIHFGPDGKLYAGVGENANGANAQSLANVLGKILRINSDGSIPSDNPFLSSTTGKNQAIWALGLRNPYTLAFQPGTGRMFINDVGQNTTEEINDGIAGSNYGWPTCEGPCQPPNANFRDPIYTYPHTGQQCGGAISGGAFYNPTTAQFPPDYVGDYFFGDYCDGWIRRLDVATGTATDFVTAVPSPVDVAVASDGSLYYVERGTGSVYRVTNSTTAVLVRSFSALRTARGVLLRWRLGTPDQLAGVDVFRDGRRLNATPLPARESGRFLVTKSAPARSALYRLRLVFLDGSKRFAATARS